MPVPRRHVHRQRMAVGNVPIASQYRFKGGHGVYSPGFVSFVFQWFKAVIRLNGAYQS